MVRFRVSRLHICIHIYKYIGRCYLSLVNLCRFSDDPYAATSEVQFVVPNTCCLHLGANLLQHYSSGPQSELHGGDGKLYKHVDVLVVNERWQQLVNAVPFGLPCL